MQSTRGGTRRLRGGGASSSSTPYNYREGGGSGGADSDGGGVLSDVFDSRVGVYGWRKRCLYFLIVLLLLILIINLALLVWITRVMDFNVDGMGKLRIHNDHVSIQGRSEFVKPLYAKDIHAEVNSSLRMTSNKAVNVTARGASLHLDQTGIFAKAERFELSDSNSSEAHFSVTPTSLVANTANILLNSSRGAAFRDFIQTAEVHGEPGQTFKLVSQSNRLSLSGAAGVELRASGSGIRIYSPSRVQLQSSTGELLINASSLTLPLLPIVHPAASTGAGPDLSIHLPNVYEVCACQNSGQLFLASPSLSKPCQATAAQCP